MRLMSTSMLSCSTIFLYTDRKLEEVSRISSGVVGVCDFGWKRRRFQVLRFVRAAAKRPWWERLFSEDGDELVSGWKGDDVLGDDGEAAGSEDERFEAWKRRAEAITELREAKEDARNAEAREWEDWLGDGSADAGDSSWDKDLGGDTYDVVEEENVVGEIRSLIMGRNDDELLFEDRVFQFASASSAKFIALLVLIPWVVCFLVHDYVLMPFLDRYVKIVPLAAELFDVRRQQKLEMVKILRVEKARYRLEVDIGNSPPLSDEDFWLKLRHKALDLRDEFRLENRRAFANIWSDVVYGVTLFILIYANKSKVALLKFTGYKLLNNTSDTGKAFLIILVTDIFLGYHSESGWQVLIDVILDRYGLEVDQAAITIFICTVPVIVDSCVKLWLFKFLPRLSPNISSIFQAMKRH